ncbi:hypothetical protein C8Q70DRAFT_503032 [Cubamyces menziesii]|nr:hypothetical protein C8Q70DRAFT_503032 [Cubamyces menziesii]
MIQLLSCLSPTSSLYFFFHLTLANPWFSSGTRRIYKCTALPEAHRFIIISRSNAHIAPFAFLRLPRSGPVSSRPAPRPASSCLRTAPRSSPPLPRLSQVSEVSEKHHLRLSDSCPIKQRHARTRRPFDLDCTLQPCPDLSAAPSRFGSGAVWPPPSALLGTSDRGVSTPPAGRWLFLCHRDRAGAPRSRTDV